MNTEEQDRVDDTGMTSAESAEAMQETQDAEWDEIQQEAAEKTVVIGKRPMKAGHYFEHGGYRYKCIATRSNGKSTIRLQGDV